MLFFPDLITVGGGISQKSGKFFYFLDGIQADTVPTQLHNDTGLVGAAMCAARTDPFEKLSVTHWKAHA